MCIRDSVDGGQFDAEQTQGKLSIHPRWVFLNGSNKVLTTGMQISLNNDKTSYNVFSPNPVSYTHLDVYKRQAQSYATHQVSFNHSFYYTGSSYSTISSTYHLPRQHLTLIGGLQSLRHSDIQGADEFGNKTNSFSASENLILIGASKKLFDQVNIGVNFKYILSSLESYHAHGFAIDIGGLYTFSDQFQHVGITIKNLGSQFKSYQTERENLPFDIQQRNIFG